MPKTIINEYKGWDLFLLTEGQLYSVGQPEDWTAIEARHSSSGELPVADRINTQIYLAQIQECDARKAEALILGQAADPLLALRSLLFRGRFLEAKGLIRNLKISLVEDDTQFAKLLVEEARLSAFAGSWSHCVLLCEEVMRLPLPGITRLTVLQIGALAYFELGQFEKVKTNLNLVGSMSRLFPKSITVFYASLLKIRVQAREQGCAFAFQRLKEAWLNFAAGSGDVDMLQALLRIEVDLRRLSRHPHYRHALGSYLVAEAMGEELYVALGLFDCAYSVNVTERPIYLSMLEELAPSFERVQRLIRELDGHEPKSTSVQTASQYLSSLEGEGSAAKAVNINTETQILILPEYELLVSLNPFKATSLQKSKQLVKVFEALFLGPIDKPAFFKKIWGDQKYAPDLHDSLIYTLLYRIKKLYGVKICINDGMLCLENALIIL